MTNKVLPNLFELFFNYIPRRANFIPDTNLTFKIEKVESNVELGELTTHYGRGTDVDYTGTVDTVLYTGADQAHTTDVADTILYTEVNQTDITFNVDTTLYTEVNQFDITAQVGNPVAQVADTTFQPAAPTAGLLTTKPGDKEDAATDLFTVNRPQSNFVQPAGGVLGTKPGDKEDAASDLFTVDRPESSFNPQYVDINKPVVKPTQAYVDSITGGVTPNLPTVYQLDSVISGGAVGDRYTNDMVLPTYTANGPNGETAGLIFLDDAQTDGLFTDGNVYTVVGWAADGTEPTAGTSINDYGDNTFIFANQTYTSGFGGQDGGQKFEFITSDILQLGMGQNEAVNFGIYDMTDNSFVSPFADGSTNVVSYQDV